MNCIDGGVHLGCSSLPLSISKLTKFQRNQIVTQYQVDMTKRNETILDSHHISLEYRIVKIYSNKYLSIWVDLWFPTQGAI